MIVGVRLGLKCCVGDPVAAEFQQNVSRLSGMQGFLGKRRLVGLGRPRYGGECGGLVRLDSWLMKRAGG